ncbi:HK97 family phage prohead protease [Arthrobacter sp. 9V]|uniref:HK97 family phage prohead protease n=1 Tax=Arthrobacter sp. 9V TaxID=2653132 RepID=UPI0012F0CE45|nr:HK97 family phage prohead protease [Arthrobacter sp. 9V]VXB25196.1 HK97 family phage prohead protease [Arthrobacter sp. 9V]
MIKMKTALIELKAASDSSLEEGQFTGYASVFGNKDSYGDIVLQGAFADSLAEYGDKGSGIPCYWAHRMDDPYMNIGQTVEAYEDDRGLFVKVQLDLETANGKQTHKLIKEGRVTQMSFAYDVIEGAWVDRKPEEGGWYYELRKLKIHEVSVVPVGANQETELTGVKDAITAFKAGRTLSAKNEDRLAQAKSLLEEVLAEVIEVDGTDVSDEEPKGGKPQEPETAKGEDHVEVKARNDDPEAALALIALASAGVHF